MRTGVYARERHGERGQAATSPNRRLNGNSPAATVAWSLVNAKSANEIRVRG